MTSTGDDDSQTKHMYDLGGSVRYDFKQYFFSVGYGHNSNGSGFDINLFHGKGNNPGIDSAYVGVGIRF